MKKTHTLCNQCLFYFVWKKCHDLITIFLENKEVPLLLKISILIDDWDSAIEILSQNQSLHLKPPPTHFVQGTQCYSSLKCAYTSSDSWIRHWLYIRLTDTETLKKSAWIFERLLTNTQECNNFVIACKRYGYSFKWDRAFRRVTTKWDTRLADILGNYGKCAESEAELSKLKIWFSCV